MLNGVCVNRLLIKILILVFLITNSSLSYALRPIASNSPAVVEDIESDITAKQDTPPSYFIPDVTQDELKKILSSIVGPIVDASMEALIPELGKDALEASRGGLGILEGDCGEGYAEAGAKAFIVTPMYEYKTVPKTDLINGRQVLERVKVDYSNLTDYDNPLDYHSLIDSGNLTYPEFGKGDSARPIKILADENGEQIKFTIFLFDERINDFRGFDVAAFVVNRGGTPVFLAACQDGYDMLYTDNQAQRLNQQVLIGKAIPILLKKLGIKPKILRINEAHTVIAAAEMMQDPYFADTAYVFTSHTPVTAGLQIYYGLGEYWFRRLGLPERFKGVFVDKDGNLNFSRAAVILAHVVNGVSRKNMRVLKEMFPEFTDKITGIMNGTGEFWKSEQLKTAEKDTPDISPEELWRIHQKDKVGMVEVIRERIAKDITGLLTKKVENIRRIEELLAGMENMTDVREVVAKAKRAISQEDIDSLITMIKEKNIKNLLRKAKRDFEAIEELLKETDELADAMGKIKRAIEEKIEHDLGHEIEAMSKIIDKKLEEELLRLLLEIIAINKTLEDAKNVAHLGNIEDIETEQDIGDVRIELKIDPDMPIAGAVRRIDYYKQQYPMLKDIIRALCQDKGVKTKLTVDGKEAELEGLGMSVVLGGIIVNDNNEELQYWVKEFISWMFDPSFKGRFVFISGNDVELMKTVAAGCDYWIEMPEPPKEASGTSGMRTAENGNVPVGSLDGWIEEFIRPYSPEDGSGNGFIIKENNQMALYNELKTISDLYYAWIRDGNTAWINLRKKIYEEAKLLYVKNMIRRYVYEVFLPARIIKGLRKISNIQHSSKSTGNIEAGLGQEYPAAIGEKITISVDMSIENEDLIDYVKAEIWTDVNGLWESMAMSSREKVSEGTFRFSGDIIADKSGSFRYKIRLKLPGTDNVYLYTPIGFSKDIVVHVKGEAMGRQILRPEVVNALSSAA